MTTLVRMDLMIDTGQLTAKQSRKSNNNKCSFFIVNLINIDDLYLNPYVIKTYDH